MRMGSVVLGAVAALAAAGCTGERAVPTGTEVRVPLFLSANHDASNVGTHLSSDEEVLLVGGVRVPIESNAQGQAIFRFNDDGTVDYKLIASNIENVVQSHIHCGAYGVNGPIRMWLYPEPGKTGTALTGPTGPQNGVLKEGTFNPSGVTCPDGTSLTDAILAGNTYVNVHTSDGVNDAVGPAGDYPGGEMRGQLDRDPANTNASHH